MPNRILKESICESESLSDCSFFAQDLYKRLITYADDYGRFNADTQIMLARLYPREMDCVTQEDIDEALTELAGVNKIAFYTSTPVKAVYGCFPKWGDHQRIRNSKAKCPDPDDTTVNDWYLQRFIPLDLKIEIIERDNFKCQLCNKFITSDKDARRLAKHANSMYHIDHIVPVSQGGRATYENLRLTCPQCNLKRKKRYSFREIVDFAANGGELRQSVAKCRPIQSNPIQSEYESESESESNARTALADGFERFWQNYPRKVGKQAAEKAWKKLKPDENLVKIMLKAIESQKKSAQWSKDGGQFIPNPATWLNQERWNDELPEEKNNGVHAIKKREMDADEMAAIQRMLET